MSIKMLDAQLDLLRDMALQIVESNNKDNRHGTREQFELSDNQLNSNVLMFHYRDCGRAEVWRCVHSPLNYWGTGMVIGCDPHTLSLYDREFVLWWNFCHHNENVEPYDLNLIKDAEAIIWHKING